MKKKDSKPLPFNNEAEQSILGAILIEGSAIEKALEALNADGSDFFHHVHKAIFRSMASLCEKGIPVDVVTLSDLLKGSDALATVGGISYVAELLESTPTAANVGHYIKIVRELAVKRELISKSTELVDSLYSNDTPLGELLDKAQHDILGVSLSTAKPYEHISDVAQEVYRQLKTVYDSGDAGMVLSGIPTGFLEMNLTLGGLQKSDLIIVAGRPSQGKSAISIQMAGYMAIQGYKIGIFPIEVGKTQLVKNILACQGRISTTLMRDANFDDISRLERVVATMMETNIFIDEHAKSSTDIVRQARKMKRERGLDAIFVDHLQCMREKGRFESRALEVDFMGNNLKTLAKEIDIPVVLVSQLNREVERRSPPKPILSDLKESGSIEQIADVVVFIYRPEYYDKDNQEVRGIAEVEIAKYRNGALNDFQLRWNRHCLRFENLCDEIGEPENIPF